MARYIGRYLLDSLVGLRLADLRHDLLLWASCRWWGMYLRSTLGTYMHTWFVPKVRVPTYLGTYLGTYLFIEEEGLNNLRSDVHSNVTGA